MNKVEQIESGGAELAHRPSASLRKWIACGIVVFLLSQVLIPVAYYFGDEPTSERFAWRMFSSIDLSTWDTHVTALIERDGEVVEQEVPIHASLQETYVKTVQRAQLDIVEHFMRKLTEQNGVQEVRFVAQGKFPSGKLMSPIRLSMKPGGELEKVSAEYADEQPTKQSTGQSTGQPAEASANSLTQPAAD